MTDRGPPRSRGGEDVAAPSAEATASVLQLRLEKGLESMKAQAKCGVCGASGKVDAITVRVYTKRTQLEYRYRVCAEDKRVLQDILATGAFAIQKGMFAPPPSMSA